MTINLEAYRKMDAAAKMEYLLRNSHRQVNIYSTEHKAYWRANALGYTLTLKEAGVYTLEDAIYRTYHCGAEKQIKFHFVDSNEETSSSKVFDHDELFENINVKFDKSTGHRAGDNNSGWR